MVARIGFILLSAIGFVLALGGTAEARTLSSYPYYEYDVRFTNPVCAEARYRQPMKTVSGGTVFAKPKDAYCRSRDAEASAARPESVQTKLLEWINDPSTHEIFFTYLTFSNETVASALCQAVETRSVKLRFIIDSGVDESRSASLLATASELVKCKPANGDPAYAPELYIRGHVPGIGFAHNKLLIVNPNSRDRIRMVFSSGNLTAGVVLHHENWHFITTHVDSHFAQAHLCLMRGMIEHGGSAEDYRDFMAACRSSIPAGEEDDIRAYFVPGEGAKATETLRLAIAASHKLSVAAHRFSYNKLIEFLGERLTKGDGAQVRILTDDDLYWVGVKHKPVGPNLANEYRAVQALVGLGAEARYLETNHREHLLHHNKFIIFDDWGVFAGAGNLTGDAFSKNFENFYFITIPEVVQAFARQYEHLYGDLATTSADMPVEDVAP